jgi:C-terminal processing protease CtpA/Prc
VQRLTLRRPGQEEPLSVRVTPGEFDGNRPPEGKRLGDDVGYVELPALGGGPMAKKYADLLQQLVRDLDTDPTRRWVVDLRRNHGGNMWPMLAGIGPVLGEGKVGAFLGSSRPDTFWSYQDGKAVLETYELARVQKPYRLKKPMPPVAVLTSRLTASSGEALVIAFRGRPRTRFLGEPTAGVPTGNEEKRLRDGAALFLYTTLEADRTGKAYEGKIDPDQRVRADWTRWGTDQDPVLRAALDWLRNQCHSSTTGCIPVEAHSRYDTSRPGRGDSGTERNRETVS